MIYHRFTISKGTYFYVSFSKHISFFPLAKLANLPKTSILIIVLDGVLRTQQLFGENFYGTFNGQKEPYGFNSMNLRNVVVFCFIFIF